MSIADASWVQAAFVAPSIAEAVPKFFEDEARGLLSLGFTLSFRLASSASYCSG